MIYAVISAKHNIMFLSLILINAYFFLLFSALYNILEG